MEIKKEEIEDYIRGMSQEELIQEMLVLANHFHEVNDYISYRVNPEINRDLLSKYEDLVEHFLKNGDFENCNYKIDIFMKISNQQDSIVELKLFYAEMAIGLSNELSRVSSQEISNILRAYEKVLQYVCEIHVEEQYNRRLRELMGFGTASVWNISEGLQQLYNRYYNLDDLD